MKHIRSAKRLSLPGSYDANIDCELGVLSYAPPRRTELHLFLSLSVFHYPGMGSMQKIEEGFRIRIEICLRVGGNLRQPDSVSVATKHRRSSCLWRLEILLVASRLDKAVSQLVQYAHLRVKGLGSVAYRDHRHPNIPGNKETFCVAQATFIRRTRMCEYPARGTATRLI
ncbi:hypothetical protein M3J09_010915 [Ascochyta lentis]